MPATKPLPKAKAKPVDFLHDVMDLRAAVLGTLGFSTVAIMERCGYTTSQVIYRLKKAQVRRANYRSGDSEMAKFVMQVAAGRAQEAIRHRFSDNGKKKSPPGGTVTAQLPWTRPDHSVTLFPSPITDHLLARVIRVRPDDWRDRRRRRSHHQRRHRRLGSPRRQAVGPQPRGPENRPRRRLSHHR